MHENMAEHFKLAVMDISRLGASMD